MHCLTSRLSKKEKVRFRSRAVMNGFVIYRSMEDITKRRELTLYWQNRRAKGKEIRTIEYVPIRLKKEIQKSEENIIRYLEEERQLKNPRVLVPEIKIDTLFCVDGFYMWVSGRSGDQLLMQGANQLVLSQEETEILKKIVQYVERKKQNKELKIYDSDHLEEKKGGDAV